MTPEQFLRDILDPGLRFMADNLSSGPGPGMEARVLLLAIAGQESGWTNRLQIGGHARSFWQFEREVVRAVMTHYRSTGKVSALCKALEVPRETMTLHEAVAWNDNLAVGMARLLLWTDLAPLPRIDDPGSGWKYYLRNWRPGKPRPDAWAARHSASVAAIRQEKTE
jgi:hypothetical protein